MRKTFQLEANRHCSSGALYTTISRLEDKGYLSSHPGVPTAERGGRAKNFLQVTESGKAALRQFYAPTHQLADGVADLTLASDVHKILLISDVPLNLSEVLDRVGKLGWALMECDEPFKVLASVLYRLVAEHLVYAITKNGEAAWKTSPAVAVKGALGEKGATLLPPGGFVDES